MTERVALIRADGNARIGAGHLVRCAALGDALAALGWRCVHARAAGGFALPGGDGAREIVELQGPPETHAASALAACGRAPDAAIVDHYELGDAFAAAIAPDAGRLVRIDDGPGAPLRGDIIVNPAPGIDAAGYGPVRALTGPVYALLRPAFAAARRDPRRAPGAGRRVLVTLGASTPVARIAEVAAKIAALGSVTVEAIGGPDAADFPAPPGVELRRGWSDLAAAIARADLVVTAGGGTVWEMCCLGVPGVVVVTAENQRRNAAALAAAGAARVAGDLDTAAPDRIARAVGDLLDDSAGYAAMAGKAWALCDGRGAMRVARAIDPPVDRAGAPVHLRPATPADCDIVFGWQSDPRVRRHFRNPNPPARDEHVAWFADRLRRPDGVFYVVESDARPAGIVRADRRDDGWEVSILIDPARAGRGIGRTALALLDELMPNARLRAHVLAANEASHRMFSAAGYRPVGPESYVREPRGAHA
ncbi:MAG: GNAT family N-acetyltransferase [Alphaproteobacteria bacterium]|nr:GNAT family N-acetyltransferase [Alphaproteobacteria bacterium]